LPAADDAWHWPGYGSETGLGSDRMRSPRETL